MYLTNLSRIDLLSLLPKGGEVAEIGVAEGDFSRLIITTALPDRLHLIDPWEHQERSDYVNDGYGNPSLSVQEDRFNKVSSLFEKEVAEGRVALHRTYSTTAAASFNNDQFDWIYIDGLHSREGVTADLNSFQCKVKQDGFILGHDYTNHSLAQQAGFGVVDAVNGFASEGGFQILLMTMENFPTYLLSRNPDSAQSQALMAKVIYLSTWIVELSGYPGLFQFQHKAVTVGDKVMAFPSFRVETRESL